MPVEFLHSSLPSIITFHRTEAILTVFPIHHQVRERVRQGVVQHGDCLHGEEGAGARLRGDGGGAKVLRGLHEGRTGAHRGGGPRGFL